MTRSRIGGVAARLSRPALLDDGGIRAWGRNDMLGFTHGVLGTGSDASTGVPLPVAGIANAVGVAAASGGNAAAVPADGTVRVWGYGWGPEVKRGYHAANAPIAVRGIRNAIANSAFMALRRDGAVQELGEVSPVHAEAVGGRRDRVGEEHVNRIALLSDGTLMAWGLKQFYPDGPVVRGSSAQRRRQCVARGGR